MLVIRDFFIALLFLLSSSCSLSSKAPLINQSFYTENSNYKTDELKVIEDALIRSETIKSLEELAKNGLRLHVDSDDDNNFYVHLGSEDPHQGGSGENYAIDKKSLEVNLLSSENYAPAPSFE